MVTLYTTHCPKCNVLEKKLDKKKIEYTLVDDFDIQAMVDKGIIRNKLKIKAAINNASIFLKIQKEYENFKNYILKLTKGKIIYECDKTTNKLSDDISEDLKKRGMKFVGSTIIYSYLQAIGVINSHDEKCFLHVKAL